MFRAGHFREQEHQLVLPGIEALFVGLCSTYCKSLYTLRFAYVHVVTTGHDSIAVLPADCERCTLCLFSFHVYSSSRSFNFHDSDHGQSYEVMLEHDKFNSRTLSIASK